MYQKDCPKLLIKKMPKVVDKLKSRPRWALWQANGTQFPHHSSADPNKGASAGASLAIGKLLPLSLKSKVAR